MPQPMSTTSRPAQSSTARMADSMTWVAVDAAVLDLVDVGRLPDVGAGDDLAHRDRFLAAWAARVRAVACASSVAGCTSSGSSCAHAAGTHRLDLGEVPLGADRELLVGRLAHELDELGAVGAVDGLAPDVRLGVAGAVPVEVVPAGAPAAPVVLRDRHLEVARVVGQLDRAEGAPQRQLPAHVGLECVRLHPREHGVLVQRTPVSGGEAGTVEEDAGAVDDAGLAGAVLLLGPVVATAGGRADGVVLPLVLAELGHGAEPPA